MRHPEERRPPGDEEETAAFKELGLAIADLREKRGMSQAELAARCEMTQAELAEIEGGRIDEFWGGLRKVAKALDTPFAALMAKAPNLPFDPGREGGRPDAADPEADRPGVARDNPAKRGDQA